MGYGDISTLGPQGPPSLLSLRLAGLGSPSGPVYVPSSAAGGYERPIYREVAQEDSLRSELRELRSRVHESEEQLKTEIEARKQNEQPDPDYERKRRWELRQYIRHMEEQRMYGTDAYEAFFELSQGCPAFGDSWRNDEIDYAMKKVYGRSIDHLYGTRCGYWKSEFFKARSWHMDRQREAQRMNDTEYRSATQDTRREDIAEKPSSEKSRLILPGQDGWF